MVLVVKVNLGDDMRRFSLKERTPTFAELMELIESFFGPQARDCWVRYKDTDGDTVTIASDIEVQEAVGIAQNTSADTQLLRLTLVPKGLSGSVVIPAQSPSHAPMSPFAATPPRPTIPQPVFEPQVRPQQPAAAAPAAFDVTGLVAVVSHLLNPDALMAFAAQISNAASRLSAADLKSRSERLIALAKDQIKNAADNLDRDSEAYMKNTQELMRKITLEVQQLLQSPVFSTNKLELSQLLTAVSRLSANLAGSIMPNSGPSNAAAGPTVHTEFTCNGCGTFPMVGTRYECTSCEDYNLCVGCERARVHAPTGHTFVKKGIDGAKPAAKPSSSSSYMLSESMRPSYLADLIIGKASPAAAAAAPASPSKPVAAPAPAPPPPVEKPHVELPVEKPELHILKTGAPSHALPAQSSQPQPQPSNPVAEPILKSLPAVVESPLRSSNPHVAVAQVPVSPQPQPQLQPQQQQPSQPFNPAFSWASVSQAGLSMSTSAVPSNNETLYSAGFVNDVTLVDGTRLAPSTVDPITGQHNLRVATKVWRIQNNGQRAWPLGTALSFVGGDRLASVDSVPVTMNGGAVAPDQMVDLAVDLILPTKSGRFISYWRLATPDGTRFGHRVWADIIIDEKVLAEEASAKALAAAAAAAPAPVPAQAQAQAPAPVPEIPVHFPEPSAPAHDDHPEPAAPVAAAHAPAVVPAEQYPEQMQALREMGFLDDEMNRKFLVLNNGDLTRAVQEILTHL